MKILMVGCGKMGGALLHKWKGGPEDYVIVDPGLDEAPAGVRLVADRAQLGEERFDAVVVAVKPQIIDEVIPGYKTTLTDDGFVLSIAAGCSIDRLKNAMQGCPVVRVMPNLPAAIGKGVSGLCSSDDVTDAQLALAREMMHRAGTVIDVEDEDQLDRFTAIAGSGPGYVLEIARSYAAAAMEIGFTEEQALAMVLGTIEGTIALAKGSEESLETLRNSVTSKGGTTAAGLNALNGEDQLNELMNNTARAAYNRAVELR